MTGGALWGENDYSEINEPTETLKFFKVVKNASIHMRLSACALMHF